MNKELREQLTKNILDRFDNPEYWDERLIDDFEQDHTIKVVVKGGVVVDVKNLPENYQYEIEDLD